MKSNFFFFAIATALVAFVESAPVKHLGGGQDIFEPPEPPVNDNDDNKRAPKGMGIGVRYWQGQPEVLLVTPPRKPHQAAKAPQFTRGTGKIGEEPTDTIVREFHEETGLKGIVDPDNHYVHFDDHNNQLFHARLLKVPYGQQQKYTDDSQGRELKWVHPSEVENHLDRDEMKQAWRHLEQHIWRR